MGRSPNIQDRHLLHKAQTFTVNINQTGINRTIDNINSELAQPHNITEHLRRTLTLRCRVPRSSMTGF